MSKKSIIFNWKMNPSKSTEAVKLFTTTGSVSSNLNISVAPPFVYLDKLSTIKSRVNLVAQDVFYEANGAFTGEISATMLKSFGIKSVLIGHSERRWLIGESDDIIARKLETTLASNLSAILCVGELKKSSVFSGWSFIKQQLESALSSVPKNKLTKLTIAYEPVWAIGTGEEAPLKYSEEISRHIKDYLTFNIPVLYGGSVTAENITLYLNSPLLDGCLIGGASLKPLSIKKILNLFS